MPRFTKPRRRALNGVRALTDEAVNHGDPRRPVLLSAEDVERLFAEKIAINDNDEYLRRYDGFDFRSRFGELVARFDFPRLITLLEFERIIAEHEIAPERLLVLNGGPGGDPEMAYLNHRHADRADYEDDPSRFDLHRPRFERSDYDFAILSQTLEHLYSPPLAVAELFDALAPGGYLWASVPTVSQEHSLPHHFITGFTPIGLACLFAHAGFEVVEIGQWGNNDYLSQTFELGIFPTFYDLSLHWRGIRHLAWTVLTVTAWRRLAGRRFRLPVSELLQDGLRNDFGRPAQTWGLARKPPDSRAPAGAEDA